MDHLDQWLALQGVAELAQDAPGLELGVGALAGGAEPNAKSQV